MKNLFIDSNIWLSLYHFTSDDLTQFEKLKDFLDKDIRLWIPHQVYDEVLRNREAKIQDLLYSWAATLGPQIWEGGKCIFHYHIWKILFDAEKIDRDYLYYYLQYDLALISKSTTKSTMVHVSILS